MRTKTDPGVAVFREGGIEAAEITVSAGSIAQNLRILGTRMDAHLEDDCVDHRERQEQRAFVWLLFRQAVELEECERKSADISNVLELAEYERADRVRGRAESDHNTVARFNNGQSVIQQSVSRMLDNSTKRRTATRLQPVTVEGPQEAA